MVCICKNSNCIYSQLLLYSAYCAQILSIMLLNSCMCVYSAKKSYQSGACRGGFPGVSGNPLKFPANENLKNRYTLIEHSNNLLKQARALIVPCHY